MKPCKGMIVVNNPCEGILVVSNLLPVMSWGFKNG